MNKNIIFIALSLLITTILITSSCDKIEAPYTEDNGNVVIADTVRKVLFEDYTGHDCVNCPDAHRILEELHDLYGDRLIVVVEHVGFFARIVQPDLLYDFRTSEGTDFATFFGSLSAPLPKGAVNREKINGSYLIDRAAYPTYVSLAIDSMPVMPDIYIELTATYNSNDSTIAVDAKLTALTGLPAGKYNLSILVTEDNIIEPQKNSDPNNGTTPIIHDYEHNDVLRGAINTTWGEEFTDAAISIGQTFDLSPPNYKIGSDWKPDDLHIVAFIYYADGANDKIVIQAEKIKLK